MIEDQALEAYFTNFCERISVVARVRGARIDFPNLDSRLINEVLGLAGVVAHNAERKYAPIAAFLAGFAVGSLSATAQLTEIDGAALFIESLRLGSRDVHG